MKPVPERIKVSISIMLTIAWFIYLRSYYSTGVTICLAKKCTFDFNMISPLVGCACMSFEKVLFQYLVILLPGILLYGTLALAEKYSGQ